MFQLFLLGVTTLSFFAFAIDRFRSSAHVSRGYEYSGDSTSRTVCKMMVVWIGALLLASPELLRVKTSTKILPVNQSDVIYIRGTQTRSEGNMVISKSQYETLRKSLFQDEQFESGTETAVNSNNRGNSEPVAVSGILDSVASNTTLYVAYDVCLYATSWNESLPSPLHIFMVNYVQFRNWWLIIFYFFLPIFFALLFAALISRRLTSALRGSCDNPVPFTGSYYLTNGGTLTSQQDPERAGFMESSVFKTNSLMSSHTHMSDALYQQRGVCFFDRQVSHNQQIRRLSPVISTEDLQDASPTVVMSNGSVRTVDSSHRLPDLSPQSPLAPSIACASGVSVISLAMSNAGVNGAGTIGSRSLPPHGHRRSIKRSSHTSKQTIRNVSREKTLNLIFVAIVLGFTLTQLPFRMATILQSETTVMSMLDQRNVEIIFGLCRYLSHITFVINPIILCLFFKLYRRYIAMRCCCCCC